MTRPISHLLCALGGAVSLMLQAEDQILAAESAPPPSTYRLFVGLDVEVGQDDNYERIEGYVNNRVHTNRSKGLVSLRHFDDMRFTHKTKLSRSPLTIENVHTEQISGNVHAARDAMRNQQALDAFRDQHVEALHSAIRSEGRTESPPVSAPLPILNGNGQSDLTLQGQLSNFESTSAQMTNDSNYADGIIGPNNDKSTAMLITARIASPIHIDDAYIVGIVTISTDETPEKQVTFFKRIGALDQKPRRIQITKKGLTGDFKVRDVKLHVYRNGQELVTNQSSKQYALTREQVHEYLTLERVSTHRGQSLDPEPAWSLAPAELFATTKADAFDYPLTVHVDAQGRVTGIDPNRFVPEKVVNLVMELPFYPGLYEGQAVASIALVNLASFFR